MINTKYVRECDNGSLSFARSVSAFVCIVSELMSMSFWLGGLCLCHSLLLDQRLIKPVSNESKTDWDQSRSLEQTRVTLSAY